eukprot:5479165-Pyramimonas_sp.AAC.1
MRYHLRDSFCWRLAGAALSRARPLAQGGKPRTRTFSTTELLRKAVAPTLPHCDFSPQKYTGPTAQEVHDMRKEYLSPGAHCVGFWRQFVSAHFTLTAGLQQCSLGIIDFGRFVCIVYQRSFTTTRNRCLLPRARCSTFGTKRAKDIWT